MSFASIIYWPRMFIDKQYNDGPEIFERSFGDGTK